MLQKPVRLVIEIDENALEGRTLLTKGNRRPAAHKGTGDAQTRVSFCMA
ncbi:hypothetical protein [Rhizobium yanglingense]